MATRKTFNLVSFLRLSDFFVPPQSNTTEAKFNSTVTITFNPQFSACT